MNSTRFFWKSCEYLRAEPQARAQKQSSSCPPSRVSAGSESPTTRWSPMLRMEYTLIVFAQWESMLVFSNQPGPREHSRGGQRKSCCIHSSGIQPRVLIMNLSKSGAPLIVASKQPLRGSQGGLCAYTYLTCHVRTEQSCLSQLGCCAP